MRCLTSNAGPAGVVLPAEGPCVACCLGQHPDVDHDGCGCPCGWPVAMRRAAITVTARVEPNGWAACHGLPSRSGVPVVADGSAGVGPTGGRD